MASFSKEGGVGVGLLGNSSDPHYFHSRKMEGKMEKGFRRRHMRWLLGNKTDKDKKYGLVLRPKPKEIAYVHSETQYRSTALLTETALLIPNTEFRGGPTRQVFGSYWV